MTKDLGAVKYVEHSTLNQQKLQVVFGEVGESFPQAQLNLV